MKRQLSILCLLFVLLVNTVWSDFLWDDGEAKKSIVVNNRVLAKVNGKPITVVDVMHKLDMMFLQRYPEYADYKTARLQFYEASWRHIMEDLVDKELMLADAKDLKLEVNNGEVRKEMEKLFGPNVVANLDKIGMSYDDAFQLVRGDMVIQRLMYLKVNMKAQKQVTPKDIREAYEEYAKTHRKPAQWIYRVVTIRDPDAVLGAQSANLVRAHLLANNKPLEKLTLTEIPGVNPTSKVTVSDDFEQDEEAISEAYRTALSRLKPGAYSQPVAQASRSDKSTVFRIFYLKDYIEGGVPPLADVETEIKGQLINAIMDEEGTSYILGLRKKHAVSQEQLEERLPPDFQPFMLK